MEKFEDPKFRRRLAKSLRSWVRTALGKKWAKELLSGHPEAVELQLQQLARESYEAYLDEYGVEESCGNVWEDLGLLSNEEKLMWRVNRLRELGELGAVELEDKIKQGTSIGIGKEPTTPAPQESGAAPMPMIRFGTSPGQVGFPIKSPQDNNPDDSS